MDIRGSFDVFDDSMTFLFPCQSNEQFPTSTICSADQIRAEVQIEESVKRRIEASIPALVKEAVRGELQASIPTLVKEAVKGELEISILASISEALKKELQGSISALVDEAVKKGSQALIHATVEEMKKMFNNFLPLLESPTLPSSSRSLPHQVVSSDIRSLQLLFKGDFPDELVTFEYIQEWADSLTVMLVDKHGYRVEFGPESAVVIEIVVLDGDFDEKTMNWTEEFKKNIAKPRDSKGNLLKGKREISLRKGAVGVSDIAFTDNSKSRRTGTFRLGAQVKGVLDGVVVKEAVSKAFRVKERRVRSNGRHETPSLEDKVSHLINVGDKICKELAKLSVYTVKEFLEFNVINPKALQKMFKGKNKYMQAVEYAKSCTQISQLPDILVDVQKEVVDLQTIQTLLHTEPVSQSIDVHTDKQHLDVDIYNQGEQETELYGFNDNFHKELGSNFSISYESWNEVTKTYTGTNEIVEQPGPFCLSSIPSENTHLDNQAANQGTMISQIGEPSADILDLQLLGGDLSVDDYIVFEAPDSAQHVPVSGVDELGTKCSRDRWRPILYVLKFRLAFKVLNKPERALKRRKLG